jgi:hypothetical protein
MTKNLIKTLFSFTWNQFKTQANSSIVTIVNNNKKHLIAWKEQSKCQGYLLLKIQML